MTEWHWTAMEAPKGQPRARASTWGGRAHMWTPSAADEFKKAVAAQASAAVPAELHPLDQPLEFAVVFYMPRPKRLGKREDTPPCLARPDIDTLVKAALDALQGAGVIKDDSLVWSQVAAKVYSEYGQPPRAEMTLRLTHA